jgi:hypothetical protein
MANFPTSLPSATTAGSTDKLNSPSHSGLHTSTDAELAAIAAKVGIDSSAVTTSHDYKLSGVTGTDKAVSKTGTETLTNKTLTSPVLTTPKITTSINDSSGNEVIKTPATASAVNELTVTNSATGNAVQLSATGDDTNIDLQLSGKGTGRVWILDDDGWIKANETWTYASTTTYGGSSGQNTTYAGTFTISGDKTGKYSAGMLVKFTQTTVKYAKITKVAYGSPNTTVTIFLGTDYSIANASITDPFYSHKETPYGFPTDKLKWTVEVVVETNSTQSPGTQDVWYNHASISLPLGTPIGYYRARLSLSNGGAGCAGQVTLSTANDSESDNDWTSGYGGYAFNVSTTRSGATLTTLKRMALAADDILYLNWRWTVTASSMTVSGIYGAYEPTIIRFEY